jgi:hypothetical protein
VEKNRRFTVEVTSDFLRELKVLCALADIHMTEAVRKLLEREINQPTILKPKTKAKARQKAGAEAV